MRAAVSGALERAKPTEATVARMLRLYHAFVVEPREYVALRQYRIATQTLDGRKA